MTASASLLAQIPDSLLPLDDGKPFVEIVAARHELKLGGGRAHDLVLARLAGALEHWATGRGEVAVERRCYFIGSEASLVPGVAYFSSLRLPRESSADARTRPRIAPDIVIEIVTPLDRSATLEEKIALYFRNGAALVILVLTKYRAFEFRRSGFVPLRIAVSERVACPGFDDLFLMAPALFSGV